MNIFNSSNVLSNIYFFNFTYQGNNCTIPCILLRLQLLFKRHYFYSYSRTVMMSIKIIHYYLFNYRDPSPPKGGGGEKKWKKHHQYQRLYETGYTYLSIVAWKSAFFTHVVLCNDMQYLKALFIKKGNIININDDHYCFLKCLFDVLII